jgi:hypothetical protein
MPRYFFDLYNDMVALDEEGAVLASPEEAHGRALGEAREMITASVEEHRKVDLTHRIENRDEAGKILERIQFERAVGFVRNGKPV